MRGTVFLDRDGTVIIDKHYLSQVSEVELIPDAGVALANLNASDFRLVIVTNQSGVGRGFFSERSVSRVHNRLDDLLADYGAKIDAYYHCPHDPNISPDCGCRKPGPGLLNRAMEDFDIDLSRSWMIGDRKSDLQFGLNHGLCPILVMTGHGREVENWNGHVCDSIVDASSLILEVECGNE